MPRPAAAPPTAPAAPTGPTAHAPAVPRHPERRHTLRPRPLAAVLTLVPLLALLLAACTTGRAGTAAAGGDGGSPTTEPPYKVTVAGDSISYGVGAALRDDVPADEVVKVIGEGGTGLARPDRFDWVSRLGQLAREFPPQVLVLSVGSNDAQDLTDATGKVVVPFTSDAAWDAEYTRRLAASFDAFRDTNTRVVWVGHLRTADPKVGGTNRRIHRLATQAAQDRPWVTVADLADLLGTAEGEATRCLSNDGLHLTTACNDEAAKALQQRVLAPLRATG